MVPKAATYTLINKQAEEETTGRETCRIKFNSNFM